MTARALSAALALDRLQATGLMRALIVSPVVVLGVGFLAVMVVVRLAAFAQELNLGPLDAGLAAGAVTVTVIMALTLSVAPREGAREGPLGFTFVAPSFSARVAALRAGMFSAPLLVLILTVVFWKRPDLALPVSLGLITGAVAGFALGAAVIRLSALEAVFPSLRVRERPSLRTAPAAWGVVGAAALAIVAFRLQAQGAEQAAGVVAAAGVALAVLGAVRLDTVRFALIASLPAALWRSLLPLLPLPFLITGPVATGMLLLLGIAPGSALGLGALAALAAMTLRLLLALSSLGRSRVGAQLAAAVELLILALIGLSGLFLVAPLWIAIRLIWLWRRGERVRWREGAT